MYFKPLTLKIALFCALLFSIHLSFSQTTIDSEDFGGGWGIWNSTGADSYLDTNTNLNNTQMVHLQDDSSTSSIYTDNLNFTTYSSIDISFDFRTEGFNNSNEDFFIEISNNGGASYSTIANYALTTNFNNNTNYNIATNFGLITASNGIPVSFNSTMRIRIRCDASGNGDNLFIDNIIIRGIASSPPTITSLGATSGCEGASITINGTNLTGATAANVTIGGTPVTSITSNNGTTIVAVIGAGTTGTVAVTTPGGTATSAATFTVNTAPTITSTTPGSRTGTGTVDISAISSDGSIISWYDSLSGGSLVGTSASGANFTTPSISTTTTYYAQASNGTCDSSRTAVDASVISYSEVIVSVDWPAYSAENRVEIYSPSGTLIATIDNGYTGSTNNSYATTVNLGCLEDLNNYYFIMYDTANDGWDGTDNITITSSGVAVINQNGNAASSSGTTVNFNVSGGICGAEIDVIGNGVSIADGETVTSSTDHTNFGDTDTGGSFTRTFTIENTGGADLTIGGTVTLATNTLFSVTIQPSTTLLATGASTTFEITFSPVAVGTFTDVVTITNDDSNENPYTFTISGNGAVPLTEGPGGVTNKLSLWLKSTDGLGYSDGASVSLWQTQARGSNALVNTVGQEPTFYDNATNNVNFNPVISFVNDRTNAPEEYDYTYTPQQYLEGASGFYTQEFFVVAIPDDTINSAYASMDLFCGDSPLVDPDAKDGTGIGYGRYTVRLDNEVITYAIGTTSDSTVPDDDRGYGIADESTTSSYSGIAILNIRDNTNAPVNGSELYYNGNNIANREVGVPQFINVEDSRFWIGRSQGFRSSFEGRVAEIITYSIRKDDTTERNKIESYLAIKYGITLGVNGTSKDYVDSDGNLIWDIDTGVAAEDVFNYDIAGIGRDDVSELNQKQSKTVNTVDDITIGHGDILATNSANSNNFTADKSYLVWGNNRGTLAAQPAITVDMSSGIAGLSSTVDFIAIGRTWKVVKKGTVGISKISIPETMLSATLTPPGDYLMFISDSPTFSPTSEYRIMSLNGSNLETFYEFTGAKKYITFGYAPERNYVRSIQFDGASDYLDAGNVLDLNPTGFTISAWIKRNNTNASIVSKRDNTYSDGGYDFKINASGNLEMSWKNGGTETITSSVAIPVGIWHHVAVIYNGTDAKLYIDGLEDVSQTTTLSAPTTNTQSFLIAAADGNELNTTSFFNGNIDEVRVWDVALTEDELRFIMNQEIETSALNIEGSYFKLNGIVPTKYDISDGTIDWSNLKGYYPMSTYTFTNCKDASGNGNTAALKNLTTVDYQTAPLPYISNSDGPWDTATTWLNNSVQNLPNSISIIDGVTPVDWNIVEINNDISVKTNTDLGREREVLALIVNSNELTINGDNTAGTGNGLTITHYLKLDGLLDLQGESQLVQTIDSNFDTTSTGSIERDQQGEGNLYRYNYWSSPVYSANDLNGNYTTLESSLRDGSFADDGTYPRAINFINAYNGATGPPIALSTYWMFKYANKSGAYSEWIHVGKSGSIYSGEGFTMKGAGAPGAPDQNYVFVGKPNNGIINLTVATDNNYLVGNPYPSAIDANQFISDNAATITGPLYFWEHYGGDSHNLKDYQGGYATYSLGGGLPAASAHPDVNQTYPGVGSLKTPGRYIPIGQSFYVVGDAIDGGTIEFNNGQRIFVKENVGTSVFMKNSTPKSKITTIQPQDNRSKFRIGFDAPKIGHRQILLTIDEKTTDGIDWGYEAEIYQMFEDDMYWVIDDAKYTIQATNTISLDKEIPLGIQTKEGGTISIKVDALENVPENTSVYIKDTTTGETYDITNQAFEITLEAGDYNNRFVLAFQPRLKTLEEVSLLEGVHIFMNNTISELQLNKIVDTEIVNVSLFNLLGQQVKTWNIESNERLISLPLKITTGVYIVRVNTSTGMLTKKIIIE
jgi:hypothetical protein